MTTTYKMKRGDTAPTIQATLTRSGAPVPLTGAAVEFFMQQISGDKVVSGAATILDAAAGLVEYAWLPDDTDEAGWYQAEFQATFPDASVETFPSGQYIDVAILPDLG